VGPVLTMREQVFAITKLRKGLGGGLLSFLPYLHHKGSNRLVPRGHHTFKQYRLDFKYLNLEGSATIILHEKHNVFILNGGYSNILAWF